MNPDGATVKIGISINTVPAEVIHFAFLNYYRCPTTIRGGRINGVAHAMTGVGYVGLKSSRTEVMTSIADL